MIAIIFFLCGVMLFMSLSSIFLIYQLVYKNVSNAGLIERIFLGLFFLFALCSSSYILVKLLQIYF